MGIIAKRTTGFSGASLANLMNEAAIIAARRELTEISKDEVADALERIVAGPEKKNAVMSEEKEKLVEESDRQQREAEAERRRSGGDRERGGQGRRRVGRRQAAQGAAEEDARGPTRQRAGRDRRAPPPPRGRRRREGAPARTRCRYTRTGSPP